MAVILFTDSRIQHYNCNLGLTAWGKHQKAWKQAIWREHNSNLLRHV